MFIYVGLGFWVLGLGFFIGFLGLGFSFDGVWGLWWVAFWGFWVGALYINIKEQPWEKKWCSLEPSAPVLSALK